MMGHQTYQYLTGYVVLLAILLSSSFGKLYGPKDQLDVVRQALRNAVSDIEAVDNLASVAASTNGFSLDLYSEFLKENPNENILYSPYSISVAMGMILQGSDGDTRNLLDKALHLEGKSEKSFLTSLGSLKSLSTDSAESLSVANGIFLQKDFSFSDDYLQVLAEEFNVSSDTLDFADNTEAARSKVNDWVKQQTFGSIQEVLPQGGVSSLTKLVLVNAIHFKEMWAKTFDPKLTSRRQFTKLNGNKKQVDMMYMFDKLSIGYSTELQCDVLNLPYADNKFSMTILLPKQGKSNLPELEKKLTNKHLDLKSFDLLERELRLSLPKFKLTQKSNLNLLLKNLGLKNLFEQQADLSRMTTEPNDLYVSGIFHSAFIEVNEEGTEASAATAAAVNGRIAVQEFTAASPFMFYITHNPSGLVLFVGRIVDPPGFEANDEL